VLPLLDVRHVSVEFRTQGSSPQPALAVRDLSFTIAPQGVLGLVVMAEMAIPNPALRARDYPYQLSGGMRSRLHMRNWRYAALPRGQKTKHRQHVPLAVFLRTSANSW
jgi:ABC-type glutathione transport system ATPase component